tara:strand:+ start:994 stop:1308 length:315 start_codon:yes stop_codon:yes gene_type:complete
LKSSLSSSSIKRALQSPLKFSTKKIFFKYARSDSSGLVFSLSTRLGSAVERNLFKRRARFFLREQINKKIIIFVQPKKQLKKIKNPLNHFKLFGEFLNKKEQQK